ncbi:MAG: carboxymuconolactone decarboxylase family protein [bacterium]
MTTEQPIALINVQTEDNATRDVAEVYAEMQAAWQMVPNPMKLYSTQPAVLRHRWEGFKIMAENQAIDARFQTLIRMLVSQAHQCDYCIGLNEGMLIGMFEMTPDQVASIKNDPASAPIPDKEVQLLLFVLKAVTTPTQCSADDINQLRELGWSDGDIFFAVNYGADMVATDILINAFRVARDY